MNLNDKNIMSTKEAAERWGFKDDSTIRKRVKDFPEGTIRKFGKQYVVTKEGMDAVFGKR
jgi:AraC-like DNA-binding protein